MLRKANEQTAVKDKSNVKGARRKTDKQKKHVGTEEE